MGNMWSTLDCASPPPALPNLEGQIKTHIERVLKEMDRAHFSTYEDDFDFPFATNIPVAPLPLLLNPPQNNIVQW